MNLDDESHLSAYLDDELDPADRLAVEWAVESSPPLAEQLRSLRLARDAVASLARPAIPRDLSPGLRVRIAADRRRARLRALARPARITLAASTFISIAASLILAMIFLFRALHPTPDQFPLAAQDQVQPKPVPAPRPHPIEPSVPSPEPSKLVAKPDVPKANPNLQVADLSPPGEVSERKARQQIARILERPRVHRIVIVTDVIDDASKKIMDLVENDARKDPVFGRISICENIVIDPERSEPAEVFAVPMDERDRRSFVGRLSRLFPDLVEDGEPSPELVTQLTEVGRAALFRGTEASPLVDPPDDVRPFIANRADTPRDRIVEPDFGPPEVDHPRVVSSSSKPEAHGGKSIGVVVSKPSEASPDFVGPPAHLRRPPAKPGDPITVLVYVTRPLKR